MRAGVARTAEGRCGEMKKKKSRGTVGFAGYIEDNAFRDVGSVRQMEEAGEGGCLGSVGVSWEERNKWRIRR